MANAEGMVTEADIRAAQVTLDTWVEAMTGRIDGTVVTTAAALELRGALAASYADVRTAGYLEGVQRGRREAAHVVLDALQDEGLFTTNTRQGEGL